MARLVRLDGWSIRLPDGVVGGPARHDHTHLRSLGVYRGPDDAGEDLEVILTTYAGEPRGEHGERLDDGAVPWAVPGVALARRWARAVHLDDDASVPPVATIAVVAWGDDRGACLVVHRPLGADAASAEAVVASLAVQDG